MWRLELYGAVNSYDTAVKLQGRWIEVELQKQSPAFWPSLKVILLYRGVKFLSLVRVID